MTIAAARGSANTTANDLGTGTVPSSHEARIEMGFQDRDDQSVPVGVMRSLRNTAGKKTTTEKMAHCITPHRVLGAVSRSSLTGSNHF
ncbi:hypothetical protein GCM10012320_33990 [Sinomonas cellulolyticus]|uniref:Uncharacterized protein n=1 Tax=Sinomonas cellulolyticus TaxID=2801916 RepID=A0ABS1K5T8_9MICC|nr:MULTISPECIES: hypothetical protein [Sinomonas]MBL0707011.1 hypothetical protein [Sinomonas cellulolyticus]GHG59719.1 hypothetical protein GCM10012320_33990 [Sinomonas sp. KCTC 49339]